MQCSIANSKPGLGLRRITPPGLGHGTPILPTPAPAFNPPDPTGIERLRLTKSW